MRRAILAALTCGLSCHLAVAGQENVYGIKTADIKSGTRPVRLLHIFHVTTAFLTAATKLEAHSLYNPPNIDMTVPADQTLKLSAIAAPGPDYKWSQVIFKGSIARAQLAVANINAPVGSRTAASRGLSFFDGMQKHPELFATGIFLSENHSNLEHRNASNDGAVQTEGVDGVRTITTKIVAANNDKRNIWKGEKSLDESKLGLLAAVLLLCCLMPILLLWRLSETTWRNLEKEYGIINRDASRIFRELIKKPPEMNCNSELLAEIANAAATAFRSYSSIELALAKWHLPEECIYRIRACLEPPSHDWHKDMHNLDGMPPPEDFSHY